MAAAVAALAVAGIIGGVGVAGARENRTIFSVENGIKDKCFSNTEKTTCETGERADLTIRTGDTVVWNFKNANGMPHNAASKSSTPANKAWNERGPKKDGITDIQAGGTTSWTFGEEGEYQFFCSVHPTMVGTITVEGEPVETPEPTPTEEPEETPTEEPEETPTFSATPSPSPRATASPDDHLNTPAPGKVAKADTTAPRFQQLRAKTVREGAKLNFWISEPATLQVSARRKGSKRTLTTATLHVGLGTRSVVLRSKSLRAKGTYTIEYRAVDAMANKSLAGTTTLKVK
ncbi:hypothetical protein DVA67_017025 [Solirubrobacter sp. CPCC 204708]|uniref:Plastocyanin/azurin family copper-binding protein n=1 Tax=Solirubrobacter deserti TaxID=2282478 RepID=A0ABT4RJA7_9ACTN|nr:plastocyanin/azurin family copper-binding protein [Solirubrobacter deserti]MBE2317687.1 hypothetical protein [Solirubrobacter deserti]MDA0138638.1 plastocyanin/azurin family copper-binding protein [Solirubrobacter deserti]